MRIRLSNEASRYDTPVTYSIESASIGFRIGMASSLGGGEPLLLSWHLTRDGASRALERHVGNDMIRNPDLKVEVLSRGVTV